MVVTFARKFFHSAQQFAQWSLFGEDGRVQRAFGREVLEHQRFTDAGGFSDFFGGGALEPFRGKQVRGRGNQAGLAIVAGVAGSGVRRVHVIRRLVSE